MLCKCFEGLIGKMLKFIKKRDTPKKRIKRKSQKKWHGEDWYDCIWKCLVYNTYHLIGYHFRCGSHHKKGEPCSSHWCWFTLEHILFLNNGKTVVVACAYLYSIVSMLYLLWFIQNLSTLQLSHTDIRIYDYGPNKHL